FQGRRSRDASVDGAGVRRILLTASGGPFRGRSCAELAQVTPAQAVAHRAIAHDLNYRVPRGPRVATFTIEWLKIKEART
ncbi:hypothetical protein KC220_27300, partial [Mycobacterium tuberculosis]|nr:hypothetical protein [Mycobacterium tuberculosis]